LKFHGYVANSQDQGTHAERAGYGDKQRSKHCWVPDELEHEADAWYSDAQRAATAVFYVSFLLDFHGSNFVLDVSCAPNIEPFNTRRSTVNAFSAIYSISHFGWIFLTCGCRGFCTTWDTTDECCLSSDFATQCQPRPQPDFY
jgi:hypothetical protein